MGKRRVWQEVDKDIFIRRIPFYFYKPSYDDLEDCSDLDDYVRGVIEDPIRIDEWDCWLEKLYVALEKLFYYYHLDLKTIFNYTVIQTGQVKRTHMIFEWVHYLELAEQLNLPDKTPKYLINAYNTALEAVGLKPVITKLQFMSNEDFIYRKGNIFKMQGQFPCDEKGDPILRWIGVRITNPKRVWAEVNERQQGYLFVEATHTTVISGLNCWGNNEDGSDAWTSLYVGPQLLKFNSEALKDIRNISKLTQKQVAIAIGTSERTYQKWESGETTPDSQNLLRLMNVLDIRDITYLIDESIWIEVEEDGLESFE